MSTDSCICRYIGPDNEKKWRDARTHLLNAHERICELEAEVARVGPSWIHAITRAEKAEAEVERLKGGGRESGAARCDACWEGRSHTHDARKEASP